MRKVRATQNIKRNGVTYKAGSFLVVPNEVAAELQAAGAIEKRTVTVADKKEEQVADYKRMTDKAVRQIALDRGVAGASKLAKEDLIVILTKQDEE